MNRVEIKFGYWPRGWSLVTPNIRIKPIPQLSEVVDGVKASNQLLGRWLYPPLTFERSSDPGSEDRPSVYARSYSINPTHVIHVEGGADAKDFGELAIALLGLLEGMRLIPEGWCHFYRTAIEPHTLSDLVCGKSEIEEVLGILETFWNANQTAEIRRCLFGSIHWLLFSQSYEHEFEQFAAQYIVLDSCFKLHTDINGKPNGRVTHSERPLFLARAYGIPQPGWANIRADGTSELSTLRNEFVHEGRYGGEPIGFAHSTIRPPITLQLKAFNTRVILGLLGVDCEYVRSPVDTRQMHGLDLVRHTALHNSPLEPTQKLGDE